MFNKYLLIAIAILFSGCVLFYNLWDSTKTELKSVQEQKITLEQELKRRNENEKNLSKRISELSALYNANVDWSMGTLPASIRDFLRKSCKACK